MESSVPYFKAALLTLLRADATLSAEGVRAFRGNPHPEQWPPKVVIIGPATDRTITHTASMTQAREEYTVQIDCNYSGSPNNLASTYEDGAYALAAAVHEILLTWLKTGSLPSGAWGSVGAFCVQEGEDSEGLEPQERDCTVTLRVKVIARLL